MKKLFALPLLVMGIGLVLTGQVTAQTFTNLYNFTGGNDGGTPVSVVLSGNVLFGATFRGGLSGSGSLFTVNTDGTGFTTIYSFTDGSDGVGPGGLILSNGKLYGATGGGSSGNGAVFALNTDGTGFKTLHSFTAVHGLDINSDGFGPQALILSGNVLYGDAIYGGSSGNGTVFAINTNGSGFKTLHSFVNPGGINPGSFILSGNTLLGSAYGGSSGYGTVFKVNTDGTGFTTLYSFTAESPPPCPCFNNDGAGPNQLILSGNNLYGIASAGGISGYGTVFSISLPVSQPQLTITPAAVNVILTWPTNATGFTLQSATDLASPVWTAVSPGPVILNGQNTMTNPISGTQQFFRLSQCQQANPALA